MIKQVVRNYIDANELMKKGYFCLGVDRDDRNNKYLIFFFEKTDEIIKDLKELENRSKK